MSGLFSPESEGVRDLSEGGHSRGLGRMKWLGELGAREPGASAVEVGEWPDILEEPGGQDTHNK